MVKTVELPCLKQHNFFTIVELWILKQNLSQLHVFNKLIIVHNFV